jgi:hypothetical protein
MEADRKAMEEEQAQFEAERKARTVVVSAAQLLQDFQNDSGADGKYKGKYLEIAGVVERSGKDGSELPYVILHAGDEQAPLKIECYFYTAKPDEVARIGKLSKGQEITLRGEYYGRVSNVQVRACELVR